MLSADPAASQLRAALDAKRSKRKTKWTTDAEIGLLTEFWGRMARRDARAFSFVFKEQQLAGPVEKVFTEQAVKEKLKQLKKVLPAEIYAWPAHTPADEVAALKLPARSVFVISLANPTINFLSFVQSSALVDAPRKQKIATPPVGGSRGCGAAPTVLARHLRRATTQPCMCVRLLGLHLH